MDSEIVDYELHTEDIRERRDLIPAEWLRSLLPDLLAGARPSVEVELPMGEGKEKHCYVFRFTKDEFMDGTLREKVKQKKLVPINAKALETIWSDEWEYFKRPDYTLTDIYSVIEREGKYTSFLNEAFQKSLKTSLDLTVEESKDKKKFTVRLKVQQVLLMSTVIEADDKGHAKSRAAKMIIEQLFPKMHKVINEYFKDPKLSKEAMINQQQRKAKRAQEEAVLRDLKSDLRRELMAEVRRAPAEVRPSTVEEVPASPRGAEMLLASLNDRKNRLRNKTPDITKPATPRPERDEQVPVRVAEAPEKRIEPEPRPAVAEKIEAVVPKVERQRSTSRPKKAEPPKEVPRDPLMKDYSKHFKCSTGTIIQNSSDLLAEFQSLFNGKGYFDEVAAIQGSKYDRVKKIIENKSGRKFAIVFDSKGKEHRCALVKNNVSDSNDDSDDESSDFISNTVIQLVDKDAERVREIIAHSVIQYSK